nr:hypothetical protein [uncultured archaeon]
MSKGLNFGVVKTYTVPFLSLVSVLALVPLVIMPQLSQIAADSRVINQNRTRLDSLEKKATDLESQSRNQDDLNSKLATAEKILPISKAIAPLVLGVQQIAINNSLGVNKIKLQPGKVATNSALPKKEALPTESTNNDNLDFKSSDSLVVFEMSLSGSFNSLQSFLKVLETGRRLLIFKNFQSQILAENTYNVQIFLAAPYSPLPLIAEDQIATPLPEISEKDEELLTRLGSDFFKDVTTTNINPGPTGTANPFTGP